MLALALNISGQKPQKVGPETRLSGQAGPVITSVSPLAWFLIMPEAATRLPVVEPHCVAAEGDGVSEELISYS